MEYCMELRALKSSVREELTMQKNEHVDFDDYLVMNVINSAVPSEEVSVDCFLDFSNGEFEEETSVSVSYQERVADDDSNSKSTSNYSFGSVLSDELSVPEDEKAGLEWVSQFVDDSLPELPLSCPIFNQQTELNHEKTRFEAEAEPVFVKTPCFSSSVPSKSRSKRAKPMVRTWSVGSLPMSESSSSSSTCSGPFTGNDFTERPMKKTKKKPAATQPSGLSSGNPFQRRCSHCQVQKTPQWRTGPLGAKTLCNACGVRYKSGRLFPEYRPACSPTFSGDVHSNSHRKVVEMRKKKELAVEGSVELTRMVPSF